MLLCTSQYDWLEKYAIFYVFAMFYRTHLMFKMEILCGMWSVSIAKDNKRAPDHIKGVLDMISTH